MCNDILLFHHFYTETTRKKLKIWHLNSSISLKLWCLSVSVSLANIIFIIQIFFKTNLAAVEEEAKAAAALTARTEAKVRIFISL